MVRDTINSIFTITKIESAIKSLYTHRVESVTQRVDTVSLSKSYTLLSVTSEPSDPLVLPTPTTL